MEEIKREIDTVFKLISSIPVTGAAVDSMAVARAKLRKVYAELNKTEEGVAADGDSA